MPDSFVNEGNANDLAYTASFSLVANSIERE